MNIRTIAPYLLHLPASSPPLSADVFLIKGERHDYIYDVGNGPAALDLIRQTREPVFILSHFHPDHCGNMGHFSDSTVYLGKKTLEKVGSGEIVKERLLLDDKIPLEIIPLPSVHAKDSLALNIDHKYLLVGDGLYSASVKGRRGYNVSLLYDTIRCLKSIQTDFVLKSYDPQLIFPLEEEVQRLEEIYRQRKPGDPYIFLD